MTFGAVAEAAAKIEPPTEVALKPPNEWKLAGTPRKRLDVLDKITAQPVYADRRAAARHALRGDRAMSGIRWRVEVGR